MLENGVSASIRVISESLRGFTDEGSQPWGRRSIEAMVGDAETLRPWGGTCRPHQDHPHRPQKALTSVSSVAAAPAELVTMPNRSFLFFSFSSSSLCRTEGQRVIYFVGDAPG